MKNIVVLGAGTGGSIIANLLAKKLPADEFKITTIDRSDTHLYQPGLLFIPYKLYGYHGAEDISRPVSSVLSDAVNFVQADIEELDWQNNKVKTSAGDIDYDWMVCSLGCSVDPAEVEGCADAMGGRVHTFYNLPGALAMQEALDKFEGGKFVIDIAEIPIKCPVAPIETAFLADYYFQQRGIRDKVDISLVTPYAGAFTKPNANEVLTRVAQEKNISIVPNFEIQGVDDAKGEMIAYDGKTVSYDFLNIIPPTRGPAVLAGTGLANDTNYATTDQRTLKSAKADNIYFMGDNAALTTSKAGSVSHFEAETVVENLLREIEGEKPLPTFDGHSNCFIESGHHKGLLVDFNYDIEPLQGKFPMPYAGPFSLLEDTYVNHLGKMAFKWIYWNLIVNGRMPDMPFVPAHMSLVGKDLNTAAPVRKAHAGTVGEYMTSDVISLAQGTTVHDAAKQLEDNKVSGMPVVNPDNELIGIVTVADLVNGLDIDAESPTDKLLAMLLHKGRNRKVGSIVDDLMTPDPITVKAGDNLEAAIEAMSRNKVNRLIVSEDGKHIDGILARYDLLKVFA